MTASARESCFPSATRGAACSGSALARLARVVLLAFDADRSGQEAMLRVQQAAAGRGIDLKVVRLPDDKDPCDLLLEEGPDSFATRAREAISFLQFQVESVIEGADTR